MAILPKWRALYWLWKSLQYGSPLHGETPLYPIDYVGKSASFTQGNALGSKRNTLNTAMSDGSLPPLECGRSMRIPRERFDGFAHFAEVFEEVSSASPSHSP